MKRWHRILALVCLVFGALVFLRMATHPARHPTPIRERRPRAASPQREQLAVGRTKIPDPHRARQQPLLEPVELSISDSAILSAPARIETYGVVQSLFNELQAQNLNEERSRDELNWAEDAFVEHEVHATSLEVVCSNELCRADIGFETARDARQLVFLRMRDTRHPVALDERMPDGRIRVVAYWGVGSESVEEMISRIQRR